MAHEEDVLSTAALVKTCRSTLESFKIEGGFIGASLGLCVGINDMISLLHRLVAGSPGQPQQSEEAQFCGPYILAESRVDPHDTLNHQAQPQEAQICHAAGFLPRPRSTL